MRTYFESMIVVFVFLSVMTMTYLAISGQSLDSSSIKEDLSASLYSPQK